VLRARQCHGDGSRRKRIERKLNTVNVVPNILSNRRWMWREREESSSRKAFCEEDKEGRTKGRYVFQIFVCFAL